MAIVLTDIIAQARLRVGNRESTATDEQYVSDDAVQAEMSEYILECNEVFGSSTARKDVSFAFVSGQQDYLMSGIATDIRTVEEVLRTDAYMSDSYLQPTMVDPRTGIPMARAAFIDQAYQQDALDEIVAMQRFRRNDLYSWEEVQKSDGLYLRLMPAPIDDGTCYVRYVSTGESASTLPDEAKDALTNAACLAFLDCMMNRIQSNPAAIGSGMDARDLRAWLDQMAKQRDRYNDRYRRSLTRAPKRA